MLEIVEVRAEEAKQRADKSREFGDAQLDAMRKFGPVVGELDSLRKQVNKLQVRNAELESCAARATEAERRAVEAVSSKAAEIERLRRQVGHLQAQNAELDADLKAVDFMGLGVGVGRRSKQRLARYSGGK